MKDFGGIVPFTSINRDLKSDMCNIEFLYTRSELVKVAVEPSANVNPMVSFGSDSI